MKPRIVELLEDFNTYGSAADTSGVYTVVDFKRQSGTEYMKSTVSNPDVNGNYQTITMVFYDTTGTNVLRTDVWTVTYDAKNKIVTEVKS